MSSMAGDDFLDKTALHRLTGYKQAKKMAAWLTAHGWIFEQPGGRGSYPAVEREYALARMSGALKSTERKSRLKLDRM